MHAGEVVLHATEVIPTDSANYCYYYYHMIEWSNLREFLDSIKFLENLIDYSNVLKSPQVAIWPLTDATRQSVDFFLLAILLQYFSIYVFISLDFQL